MNGSDIAAMWIVAVALVGAVAAHSALPDVPPRLGYGVELVGPRQFFTEAGVPRPAVRPNDRCLQPDGTRA
jgi:hypothetical protein